jgi:iron complex outermembrane receptor protein
LKSADLGNFSTRLNGTYVSKYDEKLPDGSIQHSIGATYLPDSSETALTAVAAGGIIFRWKHQLSFDWMYKQTFGLTLTQNYQSGYLDSPRVDCSVCDITDQVKHGAFQTWDLQGSYTGIKNLTLRAGVKNLTNKRPPVDYNAGLYFQAGYDPTYYDAHGQFGWVSAKYAF